MMLVPLTNPKDVNPESQRAVARSLDHLLGTRTDPSKPWTDISNVGEARFHEARKAAFDACGVRYRMVELVDYERIMAERYPNDPPPNPTPPAYPMRMVT